jgi:hypothetical protein
VDEVFFGLQVLPQKYKMLHTLAIVFDCLVFALMSIYKRIEFFLFPDVKEKLVKSSIIISDESANFFKWDKANLADFLFSWKMVLVILKS